MRKMKSRPESSWSRIVTMGSVSLMIHDSENSSMMRVNMASVRPTVAARPLPLRQLAGEDRDENDVVDAEDDFERGEGEERDPDVQRTNPIQRRYVSLSTLGRVSPEPR